MLVFSATWPPGVRRLADAYLKDPYQVYVGSLDLRVSVVVEISILHNTLFLPILQKSSCSVYTVSNNFTLA